MQIGRKIIYHLLTGNVLVDCGERQGDVVETTLNQDFNFYTALQGVQQNAVGVIQCEYGYQIDNFIKYPYHVDITKNPIDQTAIVWDINNPYGASLIDIQNAKLIQIDDLYNQALAKGFDSSATGTLTHYDYSAESQKKFTKLTLGVVGNLITYPYNVNDANGNGFKYTQPQIIQLLRDLTAFENALQDKVTEFKKQVRACTTTDQVNILSISF